jgi:hypothetical protein
LKYIPFIKASRGGRGCVWVGTDGVVVLDGVGDEGSVGVVGVGTGVSDATGVSWVGGNVIDVFGLQPSNIVNAKNTATITPCFIIASGLFAVSYTC